MIAAVAGEEGLVGAALDDVALLDDENLVGAAEVEQNQLLTSRLLAPHAQFYIREMRIIAYSQLLESYRSLTLESMAKEFGVKKDFIDADLARFIAAGRLTAVIDRVQGVVETRRPETKNAQYARMIKEGDLVLNSLQKLSRTVL